MKYKEHPETEEQTPPQALLFIQDLTFTQVLPLTSSLQVLGWYHFFINSKPLHSFQDPLFMPSLSSPSLQPPPFRIPRAPHSAQLGSLLRKLVPSFT